MRVPYDAYEPMVFQGEEIVLGIRGFTFGYDFYAPRASVVFHEYAVKSQRRHKVHMFWENNKHAGEGDRSLRRGTGIVGLAPDLDPMTWDHSELNKYGLGNGEHSLLLPCSYALNRVITVRNVSLFYKLFLIDPKGRRATQLCPFVKSGIMHKAFMAFLRPDGMGIDYSHLEDYNTAKVLDDYLTSQQPVWRKNIEGSIKRKDVEGIRYGVEMAGRIGLTKKDPAFIAEARKAMQQIAEEKAAAAKNKS